MRSLVWIGILLLLFTYSSTDKISQTHPTSDPLTPVFQPTDGNTETNNQKVRTEWFERMHRSAPGEDWRTIERLNQREFWPNVLHLRHSCGATVFANNHIKGTWKERGSRNQAGSILDINYLSTKDEIWAISDGGSLWKKDRQINNWQVVRQDIRFDRGLLAFVTENDLPRLLTFHNNWLHYSDDLGQSWLGTNDQKRVSHYDGYFAHPVVAQGPLERIAYLSKPSASSNIQLLVSRDKGNSVQNMKRFDTPHFEDFKLVGIPGQDEIWLLQKTKEGQLKVYYLDFSLNKLVLLNPDGSIDAGAGRLEAQVQRIDQTVKLFFIRQTGEENQIELLCSLNQGKDWELISSLPEMPWEATYHIPPAQTAVQYFGTVDAYQSRDGGKNWEVINYWWEYYQDPSRFLHADIMSVGSFETKVGEKFTLMGNHGGLSISYDHFKSQENLGLQDLNVGQYYSIRTSPTDPDLIYAGSQDQGLQATLDVERDSILDFDQVITGDFGHLNFTADGRSLWAAYPGSSVFYVEDVYQGYLSASYDLESEDESVWLSPIHLSPISQENAVYLAGGNPAGGAGSFLTKLTYEGDVISAQSGGFDFLEASGGGVISAVELSTVDSNYWYIATTNGRFFYSHDAGQTWEQSVDFQVNANYLYGQKILASQLNPLEVYLAGSGYSNPAVYYSTDGGRTFMDHGQGLPSTLVYDLAFNDAETLLFAATEAGPFVLVTEEQRWYPLTDTCLPNQTFWSVEYIPSEKIVRFGTYGRGIWDLQIEQLLVSTSNSSKAIHSIVAYPNPSSGLFQLELQKTGPYTVTDLQGKRLKSGSFQAGHQTLDLSKYQAGTYILQIQQGQAVFNGRLILLK